MVITQVCYEGTFFDHIRDEKPCILLHVYILINAKIILYYEILSYQFLQIIATNGSP